jgi:N-glycosylase/DNA lyase
MISSIPFSVIDEAVLEVAAHLPDRIRSQESWRRREEQELWRELVGAILGSAVSYEQALIALSFLDVNGLTSPSQSLGIKQVEIERSLKLAGYRFPTLRSRQIAQCAAAIYGKSSNLQNILHRYGDPMAARRGLVELCPGLGPKQASLFLRNVGYHDLAVLDRHVLAYLEHRRLITKCNLLVNSIKRYEVVEQIVLGIAAQLELTVADFDLAVWITVRVMCGVSRQWVS